MTVADEKNTSEERLGFQAEVSKLLHIVANALYSEKDVFLRELISNASDACDKIRYEALTRPELMAEGGELRIEITADQAAKTLTIADSGIGMTRAELIENLGTIARSGTSAFIDKAAGGDKDSALSLIGQFGVGFYAAFMVAEKVEVTSRRAGEAEAWKWASDGLGEFTVASATREARGTTIVLHLKKDAESYLDPETLRRIVKTYSDHIALPVVLKGDTDETLNVASALWTRPRGDITPEQYTEFYHHVGQMYDEPWLTIHAKAEGAIEYTLLLFIPSTKPMDLFDPERKGRVKLFVKRVFITDDVKGLVPPWLRFLRGIVDTADMDLNVSREMLQSSPLLAKIRKDIAKRVLRELEKQAEKDPEGFAKFWTEFGAVVKEGIYEDKDMRDAILKLARFRTTTSGDSWTTLGDYVARMKPNQTAVYYISGDKDALARSPQLEGFAARGVEVLLLSDPVDDFWINTHDGWDGKPFHSVTRGGADLKNIPLADGEKKDKAPAVPEATLDRLIAALKLALGTTVKDIRASDRLTDSAACLVADEGGLDMHLERLLKQHGQIQSGALRILEINPQHPLIRTLADAANRDGTGDTMGDAAHLLFDQARIMEGEKLNDPGAFARRLANVMTSALGGKAA